MSKNKNDNILPPLSSFPLEINMLAPGSIEENQYHERELSEIIIIVEGSGTHKIDTRHHSVKENDVLIIHPNTNNTFSECSSLSIFVIKYNSKSPLPVLLSANLQFIEFLYAKEDQAFDQLIPVTQIPDYDHDLFINLIRRLSYETHRKRLGSNEMIPTMFTELVIYLSRGSSQEQEREQLWLLQSPIEYLNNNFKKPLNIQHLEHLSHMSERSLFRHFKKELGCSPNKYLHKIRIQNAIKLLKKTNLSIDEIALKCGFYNYHHLSKVFRPVVGASPFVFRKAYRNIGE